MDQATNPVKPGVPKPAVVLASPIDFENSTWVESRLDRSREIGLGSPSRLAELLRLAETL
jgi:hypothetical protein